MIDLERRIRVLRAHGAEGETVNELLRYNENHFDQAAGLTARTYPCGKPPLSDSAFRILQAIVTSAAKFLERFTDAHVGLLSQSNFQPLMVTVLTTLTLEELANAESHKKLAECTTLAGPV